MRFSGVTVVCDSMRAYNGLVEFMGSEEAKTPFATLFLQLVGERVWSEEYQAYLFLDSKDWRNSFIKIGHPLFPTDRAIKIYESDSPSLASVEEKIEEYCENMASWINDSANMLHNQARSIKEAGASILVAKAYAAVVAEYSKAVDANFIRAASFDCYYVFEHPGRQQIFVARQVDREFPNVVGLLGIDANDWRQMNWGFDVKRNERDALFWSTIAKVYVAKRLGESVHDLDCVEVIERKESSTHSTDASDGDRGEINSVRFRRKDDLSEVTAFFNNNQPVSLMHDLSEKV